MINSRQYPNGEQQKSHWQTVLPITSDRPIPVMNGDGVASTSTTTISVDMEINIDLSNIQVPPSYKLDGTVEVAAA